ncbi:MAG: hypothetical protein ABJP48_09385 [Erythrobacter sp.]
MKNASALPILAILGACSGERAFVSEPGPMTDAQFAEVQEECGIPDATLVAGDRTISFTTDDGVPVTGTIEADGPDAKTIVLGRKRAESEMFGLVICLADYQERTGAVATLDADSAGIAF